MGKMMVAFRGPLGIFAAMACWIGIATAAQAAVLDFTNTAGAGASGKTSGSFMGTTYSLSSTGGGISFNGSHSGGSCVMLDCGGDGLGVGDDEVSAPGRQSIRIDFGEALRIDKVFLLDLFATPGGSPSEQAIVGYDGGSVAIDADSGETPGGDSGLRIFAFHSPILTDYLEFRASDISGLNDGRGVNDFALAGVSAVPIPAALPLFSSGLAVLGFLSWRRRRTVPRADLPRGEGLHFLIRVPLMGVD